MDTSGVYAFPAMRQLNIRLGHAFVLVFSLDNLASFEEVKNIREEIVRLKSESTNWLALAADKIIRIFENAAKLVNSNI